MSSLTGALSTKHAFLSLFEANPVAMFIYDPETYKFIVANRAAIERYGYSAEEMRELTIFDIRPPEDVPRAREFLATREDPGKSGIWRHWRRDGTIVYVDIVAHKVELEGRPAVLAMCSDVTERIRLEQRALAARDELLSVASHDLKTPLTALQSQLELMLKHLDEGQTPMPAIRMMAERSAIHSRKVVKLIDTLLDYSRARDGRMHLERERVSLTEVVGDVLERLAPEIERLRCEVRVESQPSTHGSWDRLRLEQVVTNLVSNALKYGCGRPIDIRVSSQAGKGLLAVRDHGAGIDPRFLERIFNRYDRGERNGHPGGMGLGLYIVRQILDAHGGTIRCESAPGRGSTFTAELPCEPS